MSLLTVRVSEKWESPLSEFPESLMSPIDENGKPKVGRVKGEFSTVIKDWNDLLVGISLPPFAVKRTGWLYFLPARCRVRLQ